MEMLVKKPILAFNASNTLPPGVTETDSQNYNNIYNFNSDIDEDFLGSPNATVFNDNIANITNLILINGSAGNNSNITEEFYALVKQPVFMLVILSVSYGIVFFLALAGNLSVVVVVARDKSLHTATNFFLVNMAIADMLMAIVCLPMTLLSNIYSGWQFGAILCKAVPYLQAVAVCASVNTLVVIAVDRYLAICHVMRQRNTKRMARVILLVIWIVALLLMTPWAVFYKIFKFETSIQVIDLCYEAFPSPAHRKAFFLGVIFLMCYALPLTFIVACYFMIGYRVWHRDAPGITSSKGVIEKSKVRVVKMLVVVVLLFMFSWMPLYITRLKVLFFKPPDGSEEEKVISSVVMPFAQWLGTSNCCMNPLVYCLFSQKIRRRIRAMLCCTKPELRSLYSTRSMYNSALQHSTSTRESMLRPDGYANGSTSYGHHYGGGNLYHHRSSRPESEVIRMHRSNNLRSTHL